MPSVFSQIINKKIPANIVFENEDFIAFMDIMPVQKGHVLVVPKLEVDNIFDLPLDIYNGLFSFARDISIAMKKGIHCKRIGVSVIGFEVPHAHIHLIPINSISDMDFKKTKKMKSNELMLISKRISNLVKLSN